jgi:hypothetical protein
MVEFQTYSGQSVVVSREQFAALAAWVNQQFECLAAVVRTVH